MSETFPVLDTKIDYEKEFLDKYSKDFDFPSARWLNAFFHPSLRDHVITINEVNFPQVEAEQITSLFHHRQSDHFEEKMRNKYESSVSNFVAKRGKRQFKNIISASSDDESLSGENESSESDSDSFSDFELNKLRDFFKNLFII